MPMLYSSINDILIPYKFFLGISKYLQHFNWRQTEEDHRAKDLDERKFKDFREKDRFMDKPEFQALFFVKKW